MFGFFFFQDLYVFKSQIGTNIYSQFINMFIVEMKTEYNFLKRFCYVNIQKAKT